MDKLSCIWYTWAALCELNLTVLFLRGACLVLLYDNNSLSHPQTIHHKALSLASQSLNSSGGVHRCSSKPKLFNGFPSGDLYLVNQTTTRPCMDTQTQNGKCHLHLLDYEFTFASRQYFLGMKWPKIRVREEISRQTHSNAASADPLHNTME